MGKNRESGRSKTRPSSSSLAASLLPTGVSSVGFGGYVGSSRVDVPVSREERPPRAVVDGEIAQHLNRLGRKDPTTKLKALTALSTIFMEKSEDEVVRIIPQWVFEYKRLLTDYNREVRRATHETMSNLVIAVRRALAPHLKSLMGPWWFSQFDEIPELSQAARRSLEVAFPAQEKRLDALMLYSNEIFLYLDENLKLTPQAMSDKATPADELEDMHNRVISMSLLAIAALIEILLGAKPQAQKSEVPGAEPKGAEKAKMAAVSTAEKMFSSHNYFLEFLKSRNPQVRSSAYTILGSFIKHIHHAFKDMNVISAAVLGSFQEKDPSCHSSMWDMILLFSRAFPYCWEYVSIQKNALSKLCHLLRNGFNGSSKISYPVLVLLLDLLPSKTVFGENFIMSFFESFWAGRTPHSPSEDRQAFFKALKECFLWGLFNASRCLFEDGLHPFQVNFIDNVLVNLLWREYISFERSEQDVSYRKFSSSKEDFNGFAKSSRVETYPRSYVDDVGRCILEILSIISMKDQSLLSPYCMAFQKDCLDIFQKGVGAETFSEHMDQIANFFLLLEQLSFGKDHLWPLRYLAGPLIADTFSLIKSLDSPDAIRVLTVVAQVFGPKLFVLNLFTSGKSQNGANVIEDCSDELNTKEFLQHYKDYLVPWCLGGSSSSLGSRLDLLISLIDKEVFSEQWHSIVVYATSSNENFPDDNFVTNADRAYILAMLLEKIRDKCRRKEILVDYNEGPDFNSSQWKHGLLENCAVSVACHPFASVSHARFVSAAIGGSLQVDHVHFLSKAAIVRIFEAILKILVDVLLMSSHDWIKGACSLLFNRCPNLALQHCSSVAENVEMALFSFEVLNSSFFCLNYLDKDNKLVAFILTAILIIEWERRMSPPDISDEHEGYLDSMVNGISLEPKGKVGWASQDLPGARFYLGSRASAFRIKMSSSHWRSLSPYNLMILRNALVQTARSAIFNMNTLSNEEMPTLCCSWILDVFERISPTPADEQTMLDELFSEGKNWPLWVKPDFHGGMRSAILISRSTSVDEKCHQQFAAFVEKIVCNLGVDKVLLGFDSKSPTGPPCILYSRSWLAAELLCTWKWSGGSIVHSFLPLFFGYAKDITVSHEGDLVSSVISILLDGAILHGSSYKLSFLNVWAVSEDEIGCILDPFLRALLTILFTLVVRENVWCKDDVVGLYRCVVGKLFVGTSINRSCLRVLPFILNVIGNKVLDRNSPESEDLVQSNILEWLQIPLSLPPLALENQRNEDLEGWIQVIVSLYPLNAEGFGSSKVAQTRNICNSEKMLILDNFRKQRSTFGKSAAESYHSEMSPSLSIQMLLTRLTAVSVGYCGQEFDDDDWDFVLCNLRRWIGLSVPMMEEITEKIDDAVNSKDTKEAIIRRLELVVQVEEPAQMDLSLTAIIILSLILELSDEKKLASNEGCSILEKRSLQKDRILEDVLRLFFSTGAAEAIAKSFDEEASRMVATSRFVHSRFWGLVASCVTCSANHLRNSAVQSMELWGLSTGAVSSLFALLFSCKPMHSLQFAAYHVLSTEPLCFISLYKESSLNAYIDSCHDSSLPHDNGALLDEPMSLRDEISVVVETPSLQLIGMDLLAHDRINFFLSWALLLSHLQSLSSSLARERLTQYIQDSISSIILDLIFQYIPLKSNLAQSSRKKDSKLPIQVLNAANAATHAITTCSLGFAVESLWPIEVEQMASLAGSIYGLMICLLPAYVRNWFSGLRDRSLSSAIESFTKGWCSPSLIADEFSQIKAASIADENFSVSVNKSAFEIVATYKREETGMDLVIHLPSCYPLQPVDVDCTRSLGVSNEKRRKWLLSLTAFVRNQNGAIAEAIRTWKSNFDKEFQGVEECPICYSIIHTTNHSLPRLACKTCKHKFHSACLYKWFSTSHKSLCPLCQMPF